MNDVAQEWNSPYETPDNSAVSEIIEYINSDGAHIGDHIITSNLALILHSNQALFKNMLTQLSDFFSSPEKDTTDVHKALITFQFELLNKRIQKAGLDKKYHITSTIQALKTSPFGDKPHLKIYTASAQLFVYAYQTAIIPLTSKDDPQLVTELIDYARTLFLLPFYLSPIEDTSTFRPKAILHFLTQLQHLFESDKSAQAFISVLCDYFTTRLSADEFKSKLSETLIALYASTPGNVPYTLVLAIITLVFYDTDSETLEYYLSDANTYVDVIVPKHNYITAFEDTLEEEADTKALCTYLHDIVDTNTPIDTFRLHDPLNKLSYGNASTYILALHAIAYTQTHGSTQNKEALIKQFIGRQLSVFAATTDELSLDARQAIFSILNILFRGLLIPDPERYYQDPALIALLSTTFDTLYLHAPEHCARLLHLTAIAMLTYQYSTDDIIEETYVFNIHALLDITQYFNKIDTCIVHVSDQSECSDDCNDIHSFLHNLSFANDDAEYEEYYPRLISTLQALSEKSTPMFLSLLEHSAKLVARLCHRSDSAYVHSVVHNLFPVSSLLEVLQAYDTKTIPAPIQTLEDALTQATAAFILDADHPLHQQLHNLSLKLKQPQEFHAILHTIALRYALATEQDFAEHYQQFKDQLVQQHIHLCIESLQQHYPKFATVLCDLETEMFKENNDEESDSGALFESIIKAQAIALHSIPLMHEVSHIIATRFSYTQEVNINSYLTVRQQIVSVLLEPSLYEDSEDNEDNEELVLDDVTYMKKFIEACFKKESPLAYLRDNTEDIRTQLHHIFQTSQASFYTLITAFDKGFAYSNIALEEVYTTAPYFKAYFAPQQAIQSIRDLKSKTYASKINQAIEGVAQYFETGLSDPNPKTYFKNNQAVLAGHLNLLQYTPGSLWSSLLNAITHLVCSCLSLFGTPTWLKTQLDTNKRTTGDRYMFFTGGEMQLAKIEAHKTSIAITTLEKGLAM